MIARSGPIFSILLVLVFALSGCTTLSPEAVQPPVVARTYTDALTISGRLSASYRQGAQTQTVQGKFTWVQNGQNIELTLYSPLGQTQAKITVSPERASLSQSGQPMQQAADAGALTEAVLGWALPVDGLRDWLQGFVRQPSGALSAVKAEANQALQQDGWSLRYVSWQRQGSVSIPKRIDLDRQQAPEVALRLVIDSWQLP